MKLTGQQISYAVEGYARSTHAELRNRVLSLDPEVRSIASEEMAEHKRKEALRRENREKLRAIEEAKKQKPRRGKNGRASKRHSPDVPRKAVGNNECRSR